jgi:hypothetical protein
MKAVPDSLKLCSHTISVVSLGLGGKVDDFYSPLHVPCMAAYDICLFPSVILKSRL